MSLADICLILKRWHGLQAKWVDELQIWFPMPYYRP